ncbi:copper homeostasis protein CutC [Micromonospora chaiyaphumensis]|uniref:PF03932 family protein CutC n=1 Tax=Micromonospora chaiyaphumensis TaxID=307119 RepID=A0A1C4TW39_9ACTN|nr:copper homeostasis protein CutC [Micromonospora chaiyaphumensis]SCE63617.1 copper homeostasis protein [Micromonospora chaiyaphumensis]
MTTVEICVSDVPTALVAEAAGADRLELCADLGQGGTTPSLGTVEVALRTLRRAAVRVMVRPRGGDFRVSEVEEQVMLADIAAIRGLPNPHGLAVGVVVGALTTAGDLDLAVLRRLIEAAGPLPVTVHKAFDEVRDQLQAVEDLVDLGADAVLTSGGAPTALAGAPRIAALRERAGDRLRVIAGGGIRSHNVRQVLAETGAREVHLRAPVRRDGREATDGDEVRRVVDATRARTPVQDR